MNETRKTPCYAVIFRSTHTHSQEGYAEMSARMQELAQQQPGFLRLESVRSPDGTGITISYWEDLASIRAWKEKLGTLYCTTTWEGNMVSELHH